MSQIVIDANADAGLKSNIPTTNYGDVTVHTIGRLASAASIHNVISSFSLSAIPGSSIIDSAVYQFRVLAKVGDHVSAPKTYALSRSLRTNWTELGVTWNTYDGINAWTIQGGDYDATYQGSVVISDNDVGLYYEIACTAMTQYWLSNGGVFHAITRQTEIDTNAFNITVAMMENATPEYRPKLTVTYHLPGFPVIQRIISRRREP